MHLLNFTDKQLEHFKGLGHESGNAIDREKLKTAITEFDFLNMNYKMLICKFVSPWLLDL